MSLFRRENIWWYEFWFAGRRIRESSKSESKTVARNAEQKRRRELEEGYNNFTDTRRERVRTMSDIADDFFVEYKLRLPQSATFADYAIRHIKRVVGDKMLVDMNDTAVIRYQNDRLTEGASPKTVNDEVGFLLRIMGDPGDLLRVRLRKKRKLKLKVRNEIGKAFSVEERERMLAEAAKARSPHIFLALTMALNAGMRDGEIRNLTWEQIHFDKKYLVVGRSKTEAGEGRTIPLNSALLPVLREYLVWYKERFGAAKPEWYVFPFGKPTPSDPTRPVTTLKTAWNNIRKNAKVTGRFHDNRHTLVTDLAESGAGDETIMDIAGHVSKRMLRHYSHIRMEAKRRALESILENRAPAEEQKGNGRPAAEAKEGHPVGCPQKSPQWLQNGRNGTGREQAEAKDENALAAGDAGEHCSEMPTNTQHFDVEYPQKSPQSGISEDHRGVRKARKSKILIGSSGRTRTYNPSVNSRMLCH